MAAPLSLTQKKPKFSSLEKPESRQRSGGIFTRIFSLVLGKFHTPCTLDRVCREPAQKTGVRCVLNPSASTLPVSATATDLPLRDAIKEILAGFSYAIYPADANGKLILNVLEKRKDAGLAIALRTEYASAVSYRALLPPAPIAATLQSLQEGQPVEMHIDPEVQSESEWDPQSRE